MAVSEEGLLHTNSGSFQYHDCWYFHELGWVLEKELMWDIDDIRKEGKTLNFNNIINVY